MKRELHRDYTAEQVDRGEGMIFHPHSGRPIREYVYDVWRNQYHYIGAYLSRIGRGACLRAGDPYPDHWVYDPLTGEALVGEDRVWLFRLNERGGMPCLQLS